MGNFTLGEILTIVIVILIVFGPQRLPELARRTGKWLARARDAVAQIRDEMSDEYASAIEPIIEARDELRATGAELRGEVAAIGDDAREATEPRELDEDDAEPDNATPDDEDSS